MKNILISACLLGEKCRYDGAGKEPLDLSRFGDEYNFIPVCPEVLGGLPTPRVPSERVGERVVMRDGKDVTENFILGAREAYRICTEHGCRAAILKEKSPSCGKGKIYDGSFSGTLTEGDGVAAEYLAERGILVIGESELDELSKILRKF